MAKRELTPQQKSNNALFMMFLIPTVILFSGCMLVVLRQELEGAVQRAFSPAPPSQPRAEAKPSEADEMWRKAKIEADQELARREAARKAELAEAFQGGPKTDAAELIQVGDSFESVVQRLGTPETVRYEDGPTPGSPKLLDYYWSNGECTPVSITFEGRGRNRRANGMNTGKMCKFGGKPLSKSALELPGKSCKRNRLCK